jgi:hypothetical protein
LENLIDLRYECHWKIEFFRGSLNDLIIDINNHITEIENQSITNTPDKIDFILYKILSLSGIFGLERLYHSTIDFINTSDNKLIKNQEYKKFILAAEDTKTYLENLRNFIL